MTETPTEEDAENFDGKKRRSALFGMLSHVLLTAEGKFDMEKASNGDRQKWARIIISGVEAYARLIQASQTDDLEERVSKLEEGRGGSSS